MSIRSALKPIPGSLEIGLRALGFRPLVDTLDGAPNPQWRHPLWPELFVEASPMRTPGERRVVAKWNGQSVPVPIEVDELIEYLQGQCEAMARLGKQKIR